ncbi:hypothetical protein CCR75_008453 [Bremia lactucae]|uniref:ABC transporter family G domain-containing protein n=1 Tax=Bremia lactucae TaxID=4779 RepID=A0A976IKP8_BRELC|nr:hypothetical protein CCR75_008453 [Bremia lactucae]
MLVGGLSVAQKKRVTIDVKVVANPSILFLDEPISGLEIGSALIVMRGVQSIVRTGYTVLCTIHQRREEYTAYFGDLGDDSVMMLEYFESSPGTMEIRPQLSTALRRWLRGASCDY